jgi:hypothetical protein
LDYDYIQPNSFDDTTSSTSKQYEEAGDVSQDNLPVEETVIEQPYEEQYQEEPAPVIMEPETTPEPTYPTTESSTSPAQAPVSTTTYSDDEKSSFQNAIIEGVQLTAEPGALPDEKVIAGYFIFRDKPSSYFYEIKLREKKLIFEFNDTRVGSSPVPTASEPPIKGFIIEQGKIDVNKAVKGLKPEWHDLIRIVFDLEAVPDIHVNDEYSIISFSFKWSADPEKQKKYIIKDQTPKIILWSSAGVGGIALGAVAYFLLRPPPKPTEIGILSADDLPEHSF